MRRRPYFIYSESLSIASGARTKASFGKGARLMPGKRLTTPGALLSRAQAPANDAPAATPLSAPKIVAASTTSLLASHASFFGWSKQKKGQLSRVCSRRSISSRSCGSAHLRFSNGNTPGRVTRRVSRRDIGASPGPAGKRRTSFACRVTIAPVRDGAD